MLEIMSFMEKESIPVTALQETKLSDRCSPAPATPNHALIRTDRKCDKGGGLAFLIHESIPFSVLQPCQSDGVMETQCIKMQTRDSELTVTNDIYIRTISMIVLIIDHFSVSAKFREIL